MHVALAGSGIALAREKGSPVWVYEAEYEEHILMQIAQDLGADSNARCRLK